MSAYQTITPKRILCTVSMSRSTLDKLFGFLSGVLSMALVGVIVGVTYLEAQSVGLYAVVLAVSSLLTLLLLRGIPINEISVGDRITIDFQIEDEE